MKKILFTIITGSALAFSGAASAQSSKIDVKASKVEWLGKKVVGGSHNGTVTVKSGHLDFSKGVVSGGEIVVDMNSIVNLDLKDPKWNGKLVGHLKSADFFDVANHPTSTLKITSFKKISGDKYDLKGQLTLRGITKEVSTTATLKKDLKKNTLKASMVIDRTLFDVKYGSGKFFKGLGDKMIADDIRIKATIITNTDGKKQSSL